MYRYPLWKYIIVILVMTYAVIYTLPNFYETYPSIKVSSYEQEDISQDRLSRIANENSLKFKDIDDNNIYFESIDDQLNAYNKLKSNNKLNFTLSNYNHIPSWLHAINAKPVSLGLDLKGKVHFLLQIDTDNVRKSRVNQLESNLRNFLIDNGIRYSNVINIDNDIRFVVSNKKINPNTFDALSQTFSDYDITLTSNDEQQYITASLSEASLKDDIKASMEKNLAILRTRVDELGVSQPIIQRQGKDRIIVQLPGLQDSTRAKIFLVQLLH